MVPDTFFALILLLVLSVLPPSTQAIEVKGLYQAEVIVKSQSLAERKRATKTGLADVLVKITGRSDVTKDVAVQDALNSAASYLLQHSYSRRQATVQSPEQLVLRVSYDEAQIDRLLRRAQLPIWPSNRPELLIWVVVDLIGEGKVHVDRELMPEVHKLIEQQMKIRAEPLRKPLLDLEDQLVLPARDAWALNVDKLKLASRRYDVENWSVLRFYRTNSGEYRGVAQVAADSYSGFKDFSATSLKVWIQKSVNWVVDKVAAGHTFIPGTQVQRVFLRLNEVANYKAYKAALKHFKDMKMVRVTKVMAVEGDQLDLSLDIDGNLGKLRAVLNRDKHLIEVLESLPDGQTLNFRWQPAK